MIDALLTFIWEFFFYMIGFWFLKIITCGKFEDKRGSPWVSLVGVAITIAIGTLIYITTRR